ncbi:hypothetical protein, partial [Parvibaculum sp.]|uniref:hypothetical protein n=1 Tax=Parvibaculum sp. TaxID=2024848 RepID=UPI002736068F
MQRNDSFKTKAAAPCERNGRLPSRLPPSGNRTFSASEREDELRAEVFDLVAVEIVMRPLGA